MLQRERGKQKALRIDLNYFRRRTWLGAFRGIAAAVGLIMAGSYGAWVLFSEGRTLRATDATRAVHLSTGPLSRVHAHFENDCQKCHSDRFGVALAHDAWQPAAEPRLELQEANCKACHRIDGHGVQGHVRKMLTHPQLDSDCARCHRDHQGRESVLTNVPNETCTDCHANLNAACKSDARSQLSPAVASFSIESHAVVAASTEGSSAHSNSPRPSNASFRSLLEDRGRVRFDHAQHMRAGQVDPGRKGGFRLDMLSPGQREVYRKSGQADSDFVQLECSSCHVPFAIQPRGTKSTINRDEGRFYAPVDFEKHCVACHSMNFAGQTSAELSLPHVAQREEFAKLLGAKQFAGTLRENGIVPGDKATESEGADASGKPIQLERARIEAAVEAVFARCLQCHVEEDTQPKVIEKALAGTLDPLIPQRWLQRGSFDHASHARLTRCAYCHEMPTAVGEPTDNRRVLIKGPESCVPCHRAAEAEVPREFATETQRTEMLGRKDQPTWASNDCTTCHRYHWLQATIPQDELRPVQMLSDGRKAVLP